LLTYISALDDPSPEAINRVIEESTERRPEDSKPVPLRGEVRAALDETFSLSSVKDIIRRLDSLSQRGGEVGLWANQTFETLKARSPTSLAVALELVRRGRTLSLAEAFDMEYRMAVAYCVSLYFARPPWPSIT
jgi:3-hydroxyisobutyryl-CoA hydrolase